MAMKKSSRNPMEPLFSPKPSKGATKGKSGSKKEIKRVGKAVVQKRSNGLDDVAKDVYGLIVGKNRNVNKLMPVPKKTKASKKTAPSKRSYR